MDDKGQQIRPSDADHAGAGVLRRPARPSARALSGRVPCLCRAKGGLWLTTADGREAYGELVATLPNMRAHHRQRLSLGDLHHDRAGERARRHVRDWEKRLRGMSAMSSPIASARPTRLLRQRARRDDIDSAAFDEMCFGEALPRARARPARGARDGAPSANSPASRSRRRAARRRPACPPRASCICSSRRPASPSVPSAPGSARGICCTSPTRTSISRISRRTSAIPTPRISAIRSAGSTA